ncbi:hypothetical protein M413DRAFT_375085 [Hebeloma cylindrosporum]|uniref:SMODS and SLOG-associating 2TM effector domain-containing protein n=1 Tax=Hebeloma cylindrosporum TaxID=76867 RepID=A0A0C2Y2S6_HEBCY|nr:hypothetical protein M413DRAFT_375085 [Hebeloma cylindrosporum h7]
MDHDGFQGNAQRQLLEHSQSQNSAPPLATSTQFDSQRTGAPSLGAGSISHNPLTLSFSSRGEDEEGSAHSIHPLPPLPPLPVASIENQAAQHPDRRARPLSVLRTSVGPQNRLDWIIPLEGNAEKIARERTVGERLDPTLLTAIIEKDKYAFKARLTAYTLNFAIGLQIIFGTLTTGLAVVVSGHQAQVSTAVLGGFSTLVASFLARARGSNEPELSITRVKDLEQFIRECQAFKMDYGHFHGDKYDDELIGFRNRFEELLGNANGERKLSPPV